MANWSIEHMLANAKGAIARLVDEWDAAVPRLNERIKVLEAEELAEGEADLNDPHAVIGRLNLEVAHLEVELAEARRLAHVEAEQRVSLQAAGVAKDAALGRVEQMALRLWERAGGGSYSQQMASHIRAACFAALSPDAGKGRLPPEARESALFHPKRVNCACEFYRTTGKRKVQCGRCAALDALGGT